MKETQPLTRKLQIYIDNEDKDLKKEQYTYLNNVFYVIHRVYNDVVNISQVADLLKNENYHPKLDKEGFRGVFGGVQQAGYVKRMVAEKCKNYKYITGTGKSKKEKFVKIPSSVYSCAFMNIQKNYFEDRKAVFIGEKVLRTYKQGAPIYVGKDGINKFDTDGFTWNKINFKFRYGADKSNNRVIIDRIIEGEYKLCDSAFQKKNGKIFLLLTYQQPVQKLKLNKDISVGVDLGIAIPAYCGCTNGRTFAIRLEDNFAQRRQAIRYRFENRYRNAKYIKGGKGRKRKLKFVESWKQKESNFVRTHNHTIAANVVDFAIKQKASTIKLELLKGFPEGKQDSWVLRNWSYHELQQFIKYKAAKVGIEVVFIDPYHTSQMCSKCGHEDSENRDGRHFECVSCGHKSDADKNAALNIANSEKFVTKKEQTQYYKKNKSKQLAKV